MNQFLGSEVLVRAQDTPNPNAIKFISNQAFKTSGKATFYEGEGAAGLPLVQDLFLILGVTQVYLFENSLTLTHSGQLDSEQIKDEAIAIIRTRLPVHNADFLAEDEGAGVPRRSAVDRSHLPPEVQKIEEILDRTIRPGLQADGGDVDVISFEDNEVKILYQGACGGCPSSLMGTLEAMQSILRHEMNNPDLLVVPV